MSRLVDALVILTAAALLVLTGAPRRPAGGGRPRPVYVVAHRANSLEAATRALEQGANGLEVDVRPDGRRFCANHDELTEAIECEELSRLLGSIRLLATRHPQLALLMIDLKGVDGRGDEVLALVRREVTEPTGIKLIVSVAKLDAVADLPRGPLRAAEALAIDEEDNPDVVAAYFQTRGARAFAYGDGVASMAPEVGVREGVQRAVRSGRFRFVYVWTLESRESMRDYLALGVDAIMVNGEDSGEGMEDAIPDMVTAVTRAGSWLAPRNHDPF